MFKTERNINLVVLMILIGRLVFIFFNAAHPNNNLSPLIKGEAKQEDLLATDVSTAPTDLSTSSVDIITQKVQNNVNTSDDINVLEDIYKKKKDLKILKNLIEKLTQNYEFEKANTYLQELLTNPNYNQDFDPNLHLYILLHDPSFISITDTQSIQKLIPIMDEYKTKGLLNNDEYHFYEGLIKIRNKDYEGAKIIFNTIDTQHYQNVIQAVKKAIISYNSSLNIPKQYEDGLVALSLLKNGYFSIAKKLALGAALKDNTYILPYQILAYTHFLTNNRDAATEYFLKLNDVDKTNQDLYKFLIGISFYRSKDYEQAILYLAQTNNASLQTDAERYLILSYLKEENTSNAVATRQKLLGQNDINQSDYYAYFYQAFYTPYLNKAKSEIYEENTILADMYINNCKNSLTGTDTDVCTFGEIGKTLITLGKLENLGPLTTLANTYNAPFLFQILGDIYLSNKNIPQANENYAKALSLTN